METKSTWLLDHAADVYSQSGEDGIIQSILTRLPSRDNWCVEFGAWNGLHLSNTANLIINHQYSAVLIEADPEKFKELRDSIVNRESVVTMNRRVGFKGGDTLDALLGDTRIPENFDFLSIDIDGNDYHVWKAVTRYKPKVVCVEYNPTIPTEVFFVQPPESEIQQGSSLSSVVALGAEKGYELVAALPFNAIFVKRELFPLFDILDNRPETMRTHSANITWLFSGYDGTIFLMGSKELPWHGVKLDEKRFQALPGFLRKYPGSYTRLEARLFRVLLRIRRWLK